MYKAAAKDETSPTTPPPIDKTIEFFILDMFESDKPLWTTEKKQNAR